MPFIVPTWVEPIAGVAGSLFTGIGLAVLWPPARARRRAADAEISADAHAVRAILRTWIDQAEHLEALGGPYGPIGVAGEYAGVEARLDRARITAPKASWGVRRAIREAQTRYYLARNPPARDRLVGFLNDAVQARYRVALDDLRACVECLTRAIDRPLRDT